MRPSYICDQQIVRVVEAMIKGDVVEVVSAISALPRDAKCQTPADVLLRALMDYHCLRVNRRQFDVYKWTKLKRNLPGGKIGWTVTRVMTRFPGGDVHILYQFQLKYKGRVILQTLQGNSRVANSSFLHAQHYIPKRKKHLLIAVLGRVASRSTRFEKVGPLTHEEECELDWIHFLQSMGVDPYPF